MTAPKILEYYQVTPPDTNDPEAIRRAFDDLNAHLINISRRLEDLKGKATSAQALLGTDTQTIITPATLLSHTAALKHHFTNVFYPDPDAPDQGATDTKYTSVKNIVDEIGSTENATLIFRHNGVGNTTTYNFSTTEVITGNISVIREPGAILSDTGNIDLTILGDFPPLSKIKCFDWDGTGNIFFSSAITNGKVSTVYPEWWGAIPSGLSADESEDYVNAAIDSFGGFGGIVQLSRGAYTIGATIAMDQAGVELRGIGFNEKWAQSSEDPADLGSGTFIYIEDTGFDAITVSAWFCKIRNLGFFFRQPENTGVWTPTEFGYAIGTDYSATYGELHDLLIEHIFLLNATYGIRIGASEANHNVGGIDIKDVHGQVFKIGIDLVNITDHSRVRDIHFIHGYWGGGSATTYQRANSIGIRLANVDGMQLSNLGFFYINTGIQVVQTAYGTASAMISDVMHEGKNGLWITSSVNAGCSLGITNFKSLSTEDGSYGVVIHGDSTWLQFANLATRNQDYDAFIVTGDTNLIYLENIDFTGYNADNSGKFGISAVATNNIFVGSQRRFAPAFGGSAQHFGGAATFIKDGEGFSAWEVSASLGANPRNPSGAGTYNYTATTSRDGWVCARIENDGNGVIATIEIESPSGTVRVHDSIDNTSEAVIKGGACSPVKKGDGFDIQVVITSGDVYVYIFEMYANHWKHDYN